MGISFVIGDAVVESSAEYFPELSSQYIVSDTVNLNSPKFHGDNNHENFRHFSYSGFSEFCRKTLIYDYFFDKNDCNIGLIVEHSGCIGIVEDDVLNIEHALSCYKLKSINPGGFLIVENTSDYFRKDNITRCNYDPYLAHLEWLSFWMRWSVDNCNIPAIYNY